jgi:hypothetical protein
MGCATAHLPSWEISGITWFNLLSSGQAQVGRCFVSVQTYLQTFTIVSESVFHMLFPTFAAY